MNKLSEEERREIGVDEFASVLRFYSARSGRAFDRFLRHFGKDLIGKEAEVTAAMKIVFPAASPQRRTNLSRILHAIQEIRTAQINFQKEK